MVGQSKREGPRGCSWRTMFATTMGDFRGASIHMVGELGSWSLLRQDEAPGGDLERAPERVWSAATARLGLATSSHS